MKVFDRFPLRYVAPNAVTCTSLVMGLASIRLSLTATDLGGFISAAWLILYAVLLDKLDGAIARRLHASSEFGVQLDSFSDFVTFGLSPAALFTSLVPWALPDPWAHGAARTALLGVGALYAVAAALRLAKFNVTTGNIGPKFFLGLPSTSSGGLLASGFLAWHELGLPASVLTGLVAWMALNAVLMVSNLPQPKLHISQNPALKALQFAVIASVFALILLHRFPTYLVSVAALYTLGGFVYGISVTRGALTPAGDAHDDAHAT